MSENTNKLVNDLHANGYGIKANFFDPVSVDFFLATLLEQQNLLRDAGIGNENKFIRAKEIRSDKILWIDEHADTNMDEQLFGALNELSLQLNRRCYLGLNALEFHFARYEKGAFYKRHKDAFSNDDARKISVVIYLNKHWVQGDGGELNIYNDSDTITVLPKAGTIVIFESHLEHEVLESKTNRSSITGWMKNNGKRKM